MKISDKYFLLQLSTTEFIEVCEQARILDFVLDNPEETTESLVRIATEKLNAPLPANVRWVHEGGVVSLLADP
jgi:hypothetical protein